MLIVAAAIILNNDKILIARRGAGKHLAGYWEFPGGKVEPNETLEQCLEREIFEELKINIEVSSFFMENQHSYDTKTILLKAYFCSFLNGEIELTDHDEVKWVSKSDLNNFEFAPADLPFIKHLNN